MATSHIQLVRTVLAALNSGDLEAALSEDRVVPDAVMDMSRAVGINRGVYTLDEFRAVSREFTSSWESERYETGEIVEAGDRLVVPWTNHLRGRDGIEVQARGVWVLTIRDGRIAHACLYQELEEALADVGAS